MKLSRVLLGTLVVSQAACMQAALARPEYLATNRPHARALFTLNDGQRVGITGMEIVSDTVFGRADNGDDVALPVKDVKLVEYRKLSPGRTALVVGASVVTGAALIAYAAGHGTSCELVEYQPPGGTARYFYCRWQPTPNS